MRVHGLLSRLGSSCLAALLCALSFHLAHAQGLGANRVADTPNLTQRAVLPGHLPAWATPAADRGTLPDTQKVELLFALTRAPQVQAAFEQLLADQQNPSSPRFHQWLTPQQVGAQFGPTQHDLDALTTWLTGQGLTVESITPSRIFVQASAPAAVVTAAFGTSLHTFQVTYGAGAGTTETMQAPLTEPTLPTALAPLVAYIGGLTSVPLHTYSRVEPHTATADTAGVHPSLSANASNHFLTPADFNLIYDVPAAITGTGQRVMILGGSRLTPSDVSLFESDTALSQYTPNYVLDPAYADPGVYNKDGSQIEATLDFERVYGTAPGAQVDLLIAANWLNGTVNQSLILYAINTINDPVMSLSFGACENLQTVGYVKQEDAMYSQAASQGITTLVSSGDAGVTGCAPHNVAPTAQYAYPSISDICASSYVTCVGGTQFSDLANPAAYWNPTNNQANFESALAYIPEGAWNEPNNGAANPPFVLAATGGGPSTVIAKPVWQTGTGVPADGVRDTPDLSFSAAGHDGYFACFAASSTPSLDTSCTRTATANGGYTFGFVAFSGTSASAPSMAGIAALLNSKLGGRQGNINPTLYKLAAATPAAFHDTTLATSGLATCSTATPSVCNNSTPNTTSLSGGIAVPGYQLQTGYDLITGLGSLDVNAFLTAASAPSTIATTSALSAAPTTIAAGQSVVFTDTITAASATASGPAGLVTFTNTTTGAGLGNFILGNSGANGTTTSISTAAISFPAAGTYLITAAYSPTTSFSSSSSTLSFTVTAPALPATTTTLAGTTGTITAQTPATYTAAVAPAATNTLAPTGNVQFVRTSTITGQVTNLGALIPLVAGKATLTSTTIPTGTYTISAVYTGDTSFAGSTSNTLALTSTAIPTTTTIAGLPATVTSTTTSSVTVTVVSSTGTGAPTGSIQFTVDAVNFGHSILLSSGGSGYAITSPAPLVLTTGTHLVCAIYSGDPTFATSTSTCATVVSTPTPVTLVLASSSTTLSSYQLATLTGTLNGISTLAPTTNPVTFTDTFTPAAGSPTTTNLGSAPLTGTSPAGLVIGPLPAGIHQITARYPGDATYSAATSNTITVTVLQASITLTPASPTLTTVAGTPTTDAITLTSLNFAGTENLSCTVTSAGSGTAATLPTCALSPAAITFNGAGTATATLTLSSVKRAALIPTQPGPPQNRVPQVSLLRPGFKIRPTTLRGLGITGLAFCTLLALCLPRRTRKSLRSLQILATALLLTLSLTALSGCGKNDFFSGAPSAPGTTAGSYTITIAAAGTTNVSATTTVSLTIQ